MLSAADREIRLGIWKIHILHHADAHEVWGTWLLEELEEHGHRLSPGTLYPALARLARNGWLKRIGQATHARARQSFRTTAAGKRLLKELRREVTELYQEVVMDRDHSSPTGPTGVKRKSKAHHKPSSRSRRASETRARTQITVGADSWSTDGKLARRLPKST